MIDRTPYNKNLIIFRRPKRVPASLAIILTLLLILFVYLGLRYFRGHLNPYEQYAKEVNALAKKINGLAEKFETLKVDAYSVTKEDLAKKLQEISAESSALAAEVRSLKEPRGMEKAQAYLVLSFDLRARGSKAYEEAVANTLTQLDINAASQSMVAALQELVFSDRVYLYFKSEAQNVLKKRQIKAEFLDSAFLSKESEAEKENVIIYIKQLKGIRIQEAMHGIGIISLTTQPRKLKDEPGRGVYVLPKSDLLNVTIEVINQGNQEESNVPVVAVLKTRNNKEQRREHYIISIKQNERKPVTFQNFLPSTRYLNILTITVGPLPGEQYIKNNTREFRFVME